jgi:signal transduction histidine kinase
VNREQLIQIINDIGDLSKIEAGKMDLHMAGFDLITTVRDVVGLFLESSRRRLLGLECEVGPELPAVWRGDAARFRQIMTNLVGNAVKFIERGGILIHIERIEESHDTALIQSHGVRYRDWHPV